MTSLALRAYHRQIEDWIDQGLYDQAILHCRHILTAYPKCLDTYRLLGKAFLESQKFGDANDIFQRVLSSLPDDFVSHVGISIIREDESNLNEAIWHMERAFEIQPSNNAIQGELRRLYGRRDGIEPPKVNLNRSALARMYLKGSLYSQAIAEIRMALAEDPQRPDLEVLLAKAYFETKQIPEAKEIANQLLAKLPYCYDALMLLWQISILEGKEKDAERYQTKLAELNPYAANLSKEITSVESVPDTAVTLEKLDTTAPSTAQTISQPDWAASLGVQIPTKEEEIVDTSLPDWMIEQEAPSDQTPDVGEEKTEELLFELPETESIPSNEIPDWMRDLGWEEGKPEAEQPEEISMVSPFSEVGEETEIEKLTTSEIPDWLKEIAPIEEAELPELEATSMEVIPFLEETPPTEGDSIATWLAELESESESIEIVSEAKDEELPDWVNELNNKSHLTAEISPSEEIWSESEFEVPISEETPLADSIEPEISTSPRISGQEDLPAWLTEEEPLSASEELPEWLLASYNEETTSFQAEPVISEEDTKPVTIRPKPEPSPAQPQAIEQPLPPLSEDEAFAWLENLAAKQGAEEALLLTPEQRREEPPEWIREYLESKPDTGEAEPVAEMTPTPAPEETQQPFQESESLSTQEIESEELPEWLQAALEEEKAEPTSTPMEELQLPDWLSSSPEEEWIQEFPSEVVTETPADNTTEIEPIPADFLVTSIETTESADNLSAEIDLAEISSTELMPTQQEEEVSLVTAEAKPEIAELEETPISVKPEAGFQPETSLLETARIALSKGLVDQALGHYQTLVKQRHNLDQIIQDISEALYKYPMEVRMWVLLGDAYVRKDLLSEALDAYNKAEELLR